MLTQLAFASFLAVTVSVVSVPCRPIVPSCPCLCSTTSSCIVPHHLVLNRITWYCTASAP